MPPKQAELLLRGQIAFYMGRGAQELADSSAKWLSKDEAVKKFVLFLADKAPSKMQSILTDASRTARNAILRMRKESVNKRKAYESSGAYGSKRVKMNIFNRYAEYVVDRNSAERDRFIATPIFSDSGDEDEENNEKAGETRNIAHTHAAEDSETNLELGLTRGVPEIQASIITQFFAQNLAYCTRSKRDLTPILDACAKLDFTMVKVSLVDYLTSRLSVSSSTGNSIPLTIEMDDPHEIYDALMEIERSTVNAKIHRAFGQMRLFDAVNAMTAESEGATRHGMLQDLAFQKAGHLAKELRDQRAHRYRAEYHMGRKWHDIAKWFDGTGIVLVFIIAGISRYAVSTEWLELHRQFLQHVSKYLPSIKQLVRSLGEDGLIDYCRNGYLSEDQIDTLEQVEGYTADEGNASDSDNESN